MNIPSVAALGASLLLPSLALAADGAEALGARLPVFSVVPFVVLLLSIAVLPLIVPHFWEHNRNKAIVAGVLGVPVAVWIGVIDPVTLGHTAHEYVAFIILLGSLYVIAGGVVVRGTLAGTPGLNAGLLALGGVLASLVGTTGASMLLIRPILRANSVRKRQAHVIVFFIFIVSNVGGLLTPLGDPPLFLGFLRGVPFFWTLNLWLEWLVSLTVLLIVFYIVDSTIFRAEDIVTPGDLDEVAVAHQVPISIAGKRNFAFLAGIVAVIIANGALKLPMGVQELGMLAMGGLAFMVTPKALRQENSFSWHAIIEVAVVFVGVFATMIPALAILNARGGELGIREPWQFFWATGLLSSFLDNAPTYLTFTATASGLLGTSVEDLSQLLHTAEGARLLTAISLGAVLMGANTYIGNGPNFMVKAIAESSGVRMPSFFGFMAYSAIFLVPVFVVITFAFLV